MAALTTYLLKITVDGEDYTEEVSVCEVVSSASDSNFTPFGDASRGGKRAHGLHIVAVQDTAVGSFWDLVWDRTGEELDFVINPSGNLVPSTAQPHFAGTAKIMEPDGVLLGGAADASTENRFEIDVTWPCLRRPEKVTTGAGAG